MKNKLLLSALLFILANSVYSQPASTIHFFGGYTIAMGDMKGKFGSTWATYQTNPDSNTYFLQNGFNFGMDLKFAPYKKKNFKIIGGVHFNSFSQDAQYSDSVLSVQIDYTMRIFTFSIGAEYAYVTKNSKINPFVNARFAINMYSGNYDETYSNDNTTNLTLNSAIRFGLQFGGGVDIPIGQRLGIITGLNYNMANLIGKESKGDFGTDYSLNDKKGIVDETVYHKDRSINFLQIYAGFTLYLGL